MGHPQPPSPIQVDNTTVDEYSNKNIKPKISKAFDMRYHWIYDKVLQIFYYTTNQEIQNWPTCSL